MLFLAHKKADRYLISIRFSAYNFMIVFANRMLLLAPKFTNRPIQPLLILPDFGADLHYNHALRQYDRLVIAVE
jgi:hypothetical protein